MVVPTGKKKSTSSLFSNLISFLLGASCAIFFLKPNTVTSKASSVVCNCDTNHDRGNVTNNAAASTMTSVSRTGLAVSTGEKNFYDIGLERGTDKVAGKHRLKGCLQDPESCTRKGCVREECRAWGHWYHTIYQQRMGRYSLETNSPFQFLEIGFYNGAGYDTYREFFSDKAEVHSMEISCLPEGKVEDGKWPWGNFAIHNKNYQKYLDEDRLHCGDAANLVFLQHIWTTKMRRQGAPPLRIVVDDGSHLAWHMAQSVFFWFPRIEPGGLMIVEDIQPITEANLFRTQFLPQMMSDLHFCGDPAQQFDSPCFPLLQKLLQSIHCEMHICIFERNQAPAIPDLPLANSTLPDHTLNAAGCPSIGKSWGTDIPSDYNEQIFKKPISL